MLEPLRAYLEQLDFKARNDLRSCAWMHMVGKCGWAGPIRSGGITPAGSTQTADDLYQPVANELRNFQIRLAHTNNEDQQ